MNREHLHFVTGKLAQNALREVVSPLASELGFDYSVEVLPITVAALMTPDWIAKRMHLPPSATQLMLPGYCEGDLAATIAAAGNARVVRGPKDLRQLPEFFTGKSAAPADYGGYEIEIVAEINHCPRLSLDEILAAAAALAKDGADVIDVGCDPGEPWRGVAECVRALREAGHRVSIDSLSVVEIAAAAKEGAELALSVNSSNRAAAPDWGCEVVLIPDDPATLAGLDDNVDWLAARDVRFRLDPILEPIGGRFAASLNRYMETRRRYPRAPMLMGIGNLTELTEVDSAGVNVLLLGICQELGIRSVLTTQVINWARTSVRECDLARRMVAYAVQRGIPPKSLAHELTPLREARLYPIGDKGMEEIASLITDGNFRVFAEGGALHVISANLHLRHTDPFLLFQELLAARSQTFDASHAFYLGYEMAKALTALTLGKQYRQDEALNWGFLTAPETSHRARRARSSGERPAAAGSADE